MSEPVSTANSIREIDEDGFTLLEVLVALTILSLSVAVLFGILSTSLERARQDNRSMQARVLAQSLLTNAESVPPDKDSAGVEASGLQWRLHVMRPASDGHTPSGLQPETVTATVHWNIGGVGKSLSLTTLVVAPKEKDS